MDLGKLTWFFSLVTVIHIHFDLFLYLESSRKILAVKVWHDTVPKNYEDPVKRRKFEEISKRWDLRGEVENLRLFLEEANSPVVFAHNDLIGKNIIYDDTTGT